MLMEDAQSDWTSLQPSGLGRSSRWSRTSSSTTSSLIATSGCAASRCGAASCCSWSCAAWARLRTWASQNAVPVAVGLDDCRCAGRGDRCCVELRSVFYCGVEAALKMCPGGPTEWTTFLVWLRSTGVVPSMETWLKSVAHAAKAGFLLRDKNRPDMAERILITGGPVSSTTCYSTEWWSIRQCLMCSENRSQVTSYVLQKSHASPEFR